MRSPFLPQNLFVMKFEHMFWLNNFMGVVDNFMEQSSVPKNLKKQVINSYNTIMTQLLYSEKASRV